MKRYRRLFMLAFVVLAVFSLGSSDAFAKGDSAAVKSNDKNIANKKTIGQSLAGPSKDSSNGPSKTQMMLGLGSIPVAYIVIKYL